MSKFDDAVAKYHATMKDKHGMSNVDEGLLRAVAKGLGPSIYNRDSSQVSCSDPEELKRVKQSFVMKKLGVNDEGKADKAIAEVCAEMKGDRNKARAIFYYMLTKKLGKEGVYEG